MVNTLSEIEDLLSALLTDIQTHISSAITDIWTAQVCLRDLLEYEMYTRFISASSIFSTISGSTVATKIAAWGSQLESKIYDRWNISSTDLTTYWDNYIAVLTSYVTARNLLKWVFLAINTIGDWFT